MHCYILALVITQRTAQADTLPTYHQLNLACYAVPCNMVRICQPKNVLCIYTKRILCIYTKHIYVAFLPQCVAISGKTFEKNSLPAPEKIIF